MHRSEKKPRACKPRIVVALLAVLALVVGLVVSAGSAQAVVPVHFVNGGTGAPAATLGPYTMVAFPADPQPVGLTNHATSPAAYGNVTFSPSLIHGKVPANWFTWSNGYTGDIYKTGGTSVTLTMPANVTAFYLYAEPFNFGNYTITAQTNNGTSSGGQAVSGNSGAQYFGFYTDDGTYISSITVTVDASAAGFAIGEFGIAKKPTANPQFTSASATTFSASGTSPALANTFNVTTTVNVARGVATLSCPACVLPSGVTFTPGPNGTALIAGTPAAGAGGAYPFTILASTVHGSTSQPFTLTVLQAPTVSGPSSLTWTVGSAVSGTYVATGYGLPAPTLSWSGTLPSGVSIGAPVASVNGNGDLVTTVSFAGTPAAGTGGTYSGTWTAHNGSSPDATLAVSITVDEAPTITGPYFAGTTFTVGTRSEFYVNVGPGFPASTVTVTSSPGPGLPSGLALYHIGADLPFYQDLWAVDGTPAVGTGGTYTFTFTAHNGVSPDGTLSLPVTINEAPEFTSVAGTTFTTGQANSFTVTTQNGFPPPKKLSINAGCLPAGITFVDNGNGTATISGNPALSAAGVYTCTITAANGNNTASNTQTFTLWVRPPAVNLPATEQMYANGSLGGVPMIAQHGTTITVSGSGFAPYAPIQVGIYDYYGHNLDVLSSNLFADSGGNFRTTVTVPSNTVYRGKQSDVVATGVTAPSGTPRLLRTSMTVF